MFKFLKQKTFQFFYRRLYSAGYRIIDIPMVIKGIGHQIAEPCTLLKRQSLGLVPPNYKFIIFFSIDLTYSKFDIPHVNTHLLKYLKDHFVTCVFEYSDSRWERLKFKLLSAFLYPRTNDFKVKRSFSMLYKIRHYMSDTQNSGAMFETNRLQTQQLFNLKGADANYGKKILQKLNIPEDAWFVTFHYRDNFFYKKVDFWEKNYANRCVDIESYYVAIKEIIDRGGWCIRIASSRCNPLPEKFKSLKRVIDVPDIEGDIDCFSPFLLSKCRFFLGCNSGPSLLPGYFGIPTVQVQTAPFYGMPIHHFDIFIFKKYWKIKEQRFLSIKEMFTPPFSHIRLDQDYEKHGIEVKENTSEEVLDLVSEMLDAPNTSNQKTKSLVCEEFGVPNLYCYKSASSLGKKFLDSFSK